MLEVNIRTFTEKSGKGMFPDYHEHMKLMHSDLKQEVETFLNDPECVQVYQYYSVSPLCLLEAKMLRRMNVGMSVCYIDKSVREYLTAKRLPDRMKKWYQKYLVYFFNSMDSIVVAKEELQEKMKIEGIRHPIYHCIEKPGTYMNSVIICKWMAVYQQGMQLIQKRQLQIEKKVGKMQYCMLGER